MWTKHMDNALIKILSCDNIMVVGKLMVLFTTTTYENIIEELSVKFGKKIDKDKGKKSLKKYEEKNFKGL